MQWIVIVLGSLVARINRLEITGMQEFELMSYQLNWILGVEAGKILLLYNVSLSTIFQV